MGVVFDSYLYFIRLLCLLHSNLFSLLYLMFMFAIVGFYACYISFFLSTYDNPSVATFPFMFSIYAFIFAIGHSHFWPLSLLYPFSCNVLLCYSSFFWLCFTFMFILCPYHFWCI